MRQFVKHEGRILANRQKMAFYVMMELAIVVPLFITTKESTTKHPTSGTSSHYHPGPATGSTFIEFTLFPSLPLLSTAATTYPYVLPFVSLESIN